MKEGTPVVAGGNRNGNKRANTQRDGKVRLR